MTLNKAILTKEPKRFNPKNVKKVTSYQERGEHIGDYSDWKAFKLANDLTAVKTTDLKKSYVKLASYANGKSSFHQLNTIIIK